MDPTKKELYTAKRASGVNTEDPAIQEAWNSVRSDEDAVNWLSLYLSAPTTVSVKASGSGGIHELIGSVTDDEILFCAARIDMGGSIKFFHIFFVGSNVNGMKKGKASMYESGIFQSLEGGHGKLAFNGTEDFTAENVVDQIFKLTRKRITL